MAISRLSEREAERPAGFADRESVSVIIPCYNEERFIGDALTKLAGQYDEDRFEIIVVDGLSQDQTRTVIEDFKNTTTELRVTLIDNPARSIPTALNLGVAAARGNIIARMDAHAAPCAGYIRRCVEVLRQEGAGYTWITSALHMGQASSVRAYLSQVTK